MAEKKVVNFIKLQIPDDISQICLSKFCNCLIEIDYIISGVECINNLIKDYTVNNYHGIVFCNYFLRRNVHNLFP